MLKRLIIFASCTTQPVGEFVPYYQAETNPTMMCWQNLKRHCRKYFRITWHCRIGGKVIRQRGSMDFPDYDTIRFCNLNHAKTLLLMSPAAVRHIPCNVVMYHYLGKAIVRTHLLPTDTDNTELNRFSVKMNKVLQHIAGFAVAE